MNDYLILIPFIPLVYLATLFLFGLLQRGFAPFIPSRPWVVAQILAELNLPVDNPVCIALSSGRSGFFHALEKKYPEGTFVGVESQLVPFLIAKVQTWIRRTKIKVVFLPIHHVDYKSADFIYSHLKPDSMRGLGRKLKFECQSGAVVVSTGFNFPNLTAAKVVELPDRKGRFDWLSSNMNLFSRSSQVFKKEKKAFFYEI
jgi:hypothetical protein